MKRALTVLLALLLLGCSERDTQEPSGRSSLKELPPIDLYCQCVAGILLIKQGGKIKRRTQFGSQASCLQAKDMQPDCRSLD